MEDFRVRSRSTIAIKNLEIHVSYKNVAIYFKAKVHHDLATLQYIRTCISLLPTPPRPK